MHDLANYLLLETAVQTVGSKHLGWAMSEKITTIRKKIDTYCNI